MKKVITYFITFTLAVLMITAVLAIPAFAEEIVPEAVTEEISEVAVTENENSAEKVTEADTFPDEKTDELAETETSVEIDEWLYEAIKQATPEQVEMVEKIVMGGVNALDKLGIKGFDRIRVWVEYNTATVMVVALIVALAVFFVATILQKKGLAKQSALLHSDAKDFYKAGRAQAEQAQKALKQYADRADEICKSCAEAAKEAAESAKAAHGQVTAERAMLIDKADKLTEAVGSMCEELNFLMQCSDLSQPNRDKAEAIYRRGQDALCGYTEVLPEERSKEPKEVMADENNDQA